MVLSFLYWSLRRLLELVVLRLRSEREKEIEILLPRHQLRMLQRQVARPALTAADRAAGGAVWVPARSPPRSRSTQTVLAASLIPSPTNSPSRAGRSSYGRQPVNFCAGCRRASSLRATRRVPRLCASCRKSLA